MQPVQTIYEQHNSAFIVVAWAFENAIAFLPNSEKSKIFKEFISKEIKNITHSPSIKLYYNDNNKPLIKDTEYKSISVTHTKNFLAVQLHKEYFAGIDIESPREQLLKVKHKFLNDEEITIANNSIDMLCRFWTVKEALFKVYGYSHISLKQHIRIKQSENQYITAQLSVNNTTEEFLLYSHLLNSGMHLTYVVKKN